MVSHNFKKKTNAKNKAKSLRKKGKNASVFKKKDGWGVSSTNK